GALFFTHLVKSCASVAQCAPPPNRSTLDRRVRRPSTPGRAEIACTRVRAWRRDSVRAQRRRPGAGGGGVLRGGAPRARVAAVGQRRPGRRPCRATEGAVYGMATDGDARPVGRRCPRRAVRARPRIRAESRRLLA